MSRLEFAACLALFVVGVFSTSFGPAMQVLADDFGVSLSRAGLLLTVLFFGSIAASGLMAVWLHRYDPRRAAAAGLGLVTVGAGGIALSGSWEALLACAALTGFGAGLMDAGVHTIVARVSKDVARGINRLNVCFAIGAVAGPLWSAGVFELDEDGRAVVYLGIAALAAAACAVMVAARPATTALVGESAPAVHHARMSRLAWVMGAVLFLYVGAEFGLGSWVASYTDESFGAGIMTGGLVTAGYWGALMVGRLLSGALFANGARASSVLLGSIACALVASAAIALAHDAFAIAVVAALCTGLAFGPIWPAAMAIAAEGRASSTPAAMVTIGNSGGFVFPWLQGQLLVSAGASTGIAMSAALCALMLAVAWRGSRMRRR